MDSCGQGSGVVSGRKINWQKQSNKNCATDQQQKSRLAAHRPTESAAPLDGEPGKKRKRQRRTEVKEPERNRLQQQCSNRMKMRQSVLANYRSTLIKFPHHLMVVFRRRTQ